MKFVKNFDPIDLEIEIYYMYYGLQLHKQNFLQFLKIHLKIQVNVRMFV